MGLRGEFTSFGNSPSPSLTALTTIRAVQIPMVNDRLLGIQIKCQKTFATVFS